MRAENSRIKNKEMESAKVAYLTLGSVLVSLLFTKMFNWDYLEEALSEQSCQNTGKQELVCSTTAKTFSHVVEP